MDCDVVWILNVFCALGMLLDVCMHISCTLIDTDTPLMSDIFQLFTLHRIFSIFIKFPECDTIYCVYTTQNDISMHSSTASSLQVSVVNNTLFSNNVFITLYIFIYFKKKCKWHKLKSKRMQILKEAQLCPI